MTAKQTIESGKAILGIEFGSTRIKAVLIDEDYKPIAQGSHTWENQLVDGLWTYSTEAIWYGLQDCYAQLRKNVLEQYEVEIETLAAIGISAMMHGYMAFKGNDILVPFRTWRNTNTGKAAAELSKLFNYNIPLRWSISHLYEAILDNEEHVKDIKFLTTLAGYIHWQITGQKVLGVGDASGMIPVDPKTKTTMLRWWRSSTNSSSQEASDGSCSTSCPSHSTLARTQDSSPQKVLTVSTCRAT